MKAVSTAASAMRHTFGAFLEAVIFVAIVAALVFGIAVATGKGPGGALDAAAAHSRYSGTLAANPDTLQSGDYFDVHGCGYDTSLGNVIIGFTGGSWGSPLDSKGCFTITDIPALSGDVLPAGVYEVSAYQYIKGRWRETGDTTVTVVH